MKAMPLRLSSDIYHSLDFIRKDVDLLAEKDFYFVDLCGLHRRHALRELVASVMASYNACIINYDINFATIRRYHSDEAGSLHLCEDFSIFRNGNASFRTDNVIVYGTKSIPCGKVYPKADQWTLSERKDVAELVRQLQGS